MSWKTNGMGGWLTASTVLFLLLMAPIFAVTVPVGSEKRPLLSELDDELLERLVGSIGQTATISAVMDVGLGTPRCSERSIEAMQRLAAVSNDVQVLGQISDGRLVCSSYVVSKASSVHGADSKNRSRGLTLALAAMASRPSWKSTSVEKSLEDFISQRVPQSAAAVNTVYPL